MTTDQKIHDGMRNIYQLALIQTATSKEFNESQLYQDMNISCSF